MNRFIKILICLSIFLLAVTSCNMVFADEFVYEGYSCGDMNFLLTTISEQDNLANSAHQMAKSARELGYKENHPTILLAKEEYQSAKAKKEKYQDIYDKLMEHWQIKREEYPTATYIWEYLKKLGYDDEVCAGIMGNLMAEVGGQTLELNWQSDNGSYYGICQWSKTYSGVWGASLEEQCQFLRDTIRYELDTYGYAYKKNFNYEKFLKLGSAEKAAKAFAVCYERCGSASYKVRQANAAEALKYFQS